jgi:urease accessory protein
MQALKMFAGRRGLRVAAASVASVGLLACGVAEAHPGHGTHGLVDGLAHPLGLDHLLAMVAVGAWSAAALPARRVALGPLVFMLSLLAGALLGMATGSIAGVEAMVATSVVLFGALLAGVRRWSVSAGLSLVAVSALVHGLAHGAEWPVASSAVAYVSGFLLSTAALHALGLLAGMAARRASPRAWQVAGALMGAAGLMLLARI